MEFYCSYKYLDDVTAVFIPGSRDVDTTSVHEERRGIKREWAVRSETTVDTSGIGRTRNWTHQELEAALG